MKASLLILVLSFSLLFQNDGEKYVQVSDIMLHKTTIDEALVLLGDTKIVKDGDSSESSSRINYFLEKENCYLVLSSGELGEGTIINNFRLSKNINSEPFKKLPGITLLSEDLGGLRLDMSKSELQKIIGKNIPPNENHYTEHYTDEIEIKNQKFDRQITVEIIFEMEKVVSVNIWKTVTN